jgi:hypothetical protein
MRADSRKTIAQDHMDVYQDGRAGLGMNIPPDPDIL